MIEALPKEMWWRQHRVRRVGASLVGGLVFGAPIAAAHTLESTAIHDDVAGIPSTISFTIGESKLHTGLGGTVYGNNEFSQSILGMRVGVDIQLEQPPTALQSIGNSSPSALIEPFTQYYSQPEQAFGGTKDALFDEAKRTFWQIYPLAAVVTAGLSAGALRLSREGSRQDKLAGFAAVAALSVGATYLAMPHETAAELEPIEIAGLEGTSFEGFSTNSSITSDILSRTAPFIEDQIERINQQRARFIDQAQETINTEIANQTLTVPQNGEQMVLLGADLHSNLAMTEVYKYLIERVNESSDTPIIDTFIMAGDQTYGSAAEKVATDAMATIAPNVVVVNGDHDSKITDNNQRDAGITTLSPDTPFVLDDLTILGGDDPVITTLQSLVGSSSAAISRDGGKQLSISEERDLQQYLGETLSEAADKDMPDIIVSHEAYSIGPLVDSEFRTKASTEQWLETNVSAMTLPSDMIIFGHWHPRRSIIYTAQNGVILQLGSAGGASARNSFGEFSTPFTTPAQPASVMFATFDNEQNLVRLQEVVTNRDGTVSIQPAAQIAQQ